MVNEFHVILRHIAVIVDAEGHVGQAIGRPQPGSMDRLASGPYDEKNLWHGLQHGVLNETSLECTNLRLRVPNSTLLFVVFPASDQA